ncbi:MAG: VOC family protein [Exilibacterium sp.]
MIGYLTIGTNNLETAIAFYDSLLGAMGASKAFQTENLAAWGFGEGSTLLMVTKPFDGNSATVGNGVMVALSVASPEAVDTLHAKALELGAANEGDPGFRGKGFYGAYFRDIDGNKLNFFCYT